MMYGYNFGYDGGWSMMDWGLGGIFMVLVVVNLALSAIWLWKQIQK